MRRHYGHVRPLATRYRPAPLVPGSLAWTIAELYRVPMQTLRDTESLFMARLRAASEDWAMNVVPFLPGVRPPA